MQFYKFDILYGQLFPLHSEPLQKANRYGIEAYLEMV